MKVKIALDYFLNNCIVKGLLPRTIQNYEAFVKSFLRWAGDIDDSELNYPLIQDYIKSIYDRKVSKATAGTYIRHLKVFLRYLEKEGYINNITEKIKVPKQPKKLVVVYSDEEIKSIFETIDHETEWIRYRNCCMIAFMLDSGLRLNEVCAIDLSDLDIKQNILKVHGKGDKERLVPIGQFTKYYLRKYLAIYPEESQALFIGRVGGRITRNAVKLIVQRLSTKLNFQFGSHKLRHNFATNYCLDQYEKTGQVDIYKLMILLGHEDIQTTRRYLHMANQIIISNSNVSHLDKIYLMKP